MMQTGLSKIINRTGRLPPVTLEIKPLQGTATYSFDKFTAYNFSSSLVVPVDSFTFEFCAPGDSRSFTDYVTEGDIASLYADGKLVATGIVDQVEVEVDYENGERARVVGRDLLGQLEDNAAITIDKAPIWGQNVTLEEAAKYFVDGTRIPGVKTSDTPTTPTLLASEPGESRISALLRHAEPLNCLIWSDPAGYLVVGRPSMAGAHAGTLICNRNRRASNVFSMRATYSATSIPNKIVVIWSDVQSTQIGIPANQIFDNAAVGPSRLRQRGHNVIHTSMTSIPNGADAQSLAAAAQFQVASAANQTLLQAQAKREFARANMNELIVQAVVPGHFNENGDVYRPNQMYMVDSDRLGVNEKMFLYAVEWNLSADRGQYTNLWLCRLGTIVADVRVK